MLAVLTVLYLWPQTLGRRVLYWGDIGLYFAPMLGLLHDTLRSGRLPLWNPSLMCGTPYIGNPQTWPLYQVSVLMRWLPVGAFINATVAFHLWLAGLGTYLFCRRTQGASLLGALLAALTFMFGGQLVSKEQFPNMVQAAAYLPIVLLLLHRLLHRPTLGAALCLGTALGLQTLAAHAQMSVLTLYLAIAYALATQRSLISRRVLGLSLLSGVIALGLAAGQLLPTIELFQNAARQSLPFHVVNRFYLPWTQLLNFILPGLHGHPYFSDFTARGNFWETCCYVGLAPFAFAILAIVVAWKPTGTKGTRFWSVVFIVGVWMALGGGGGLYYLAFRALPGFRSFHDPARCLLWACFALAVLSAAGLDYARRHFRAFAPRIRGRQVSAGLLGIAFLQLAVFGRTLYPTADPATLHPITPIVVAVQNDPDIRAGQARFLAPDSARVWPRFTGHRAYRQDAPNYLNLWADTLTPNLMMPYGLRDAYGYEPMTRRDTQRISGTATQGFRPEGKGYERRAASAWAGMLGVKYVALYRRQVTVPGLKPLRSAPTLPLFPHRPDASEVWLAQNTDWLPRARLITRFQTVDSPEEALALMSRSLKAPGLWDARRTTLIAGTVPFASVNGETVAAPVEDVSPNEVTVRAVTTKPTILVLADTDHPGWTATVDGRAAPILSADACLRAVALPAPGAHVVRFVYRPVSFLVGLYFTFLTVAVLCSALGWQVGVKIWRRMPGEKELAVPSVYNTL